MQKMEQNITSTKNSKSFKDKATLLGNTVLQDAPNQANGILRKCNNCFAIKLFK